MSAALLEYRDVDLGYGRNIVLRSVSFSLFRGDYLGVVGPNGSGKTTLLRSMFGLIKPRRGEIVIQQPGLRFGYVPQRKDIEEHLPLTAREVARMGLYPELGFLGRFGRAEERRVEEGLSRVGMKELGEKLYSELSGGQKQRVLIARVLLRGADVLLLDEPTHDMDVSAAGEIMRLIERLHAEAGVTVVLVTHLHDLVGMHAGRVAILGEERFIVGEKSEMLVDERLLLSHGIAQQAPLPGPDCPVRREGGA